MRNKALSAHKAVPALQRKVTDADRKLIRALASVISSRATLAGQLGKQLFGGDRDIYQALGYPRTVDISALRIRLARDGIAKRVLHAYPDATWGGGAVEIYEDVDPSKTTPFEAAWKTLTERINFHRAWRSTDRLAGIGRYALLVFGFDDARNAEALKNPVNPSPKRKLLFVRPFAEDNATIQDVETDVGNPRFGRPKTYKVKIASVRDGSFNMGSATEVMVHHSRVVHVADNADEDEMFGVPRLEPVFNYLLNLELIACASAEMFWRGAYRGFSVEGEPGVRFTESDLEDMEDQVEDYVHGLNRYLMLQGAKMSPMAPKIEDPTASVDVQIKLISGATGIPARLLTGSERGELASEQDRENWSDRVEERRETFAKPCLVQQTLERLWEAGVLPKPKSWFVDWPSLEVTGAKQKADIAESRTRSLSLYAGSGASAIITPLDFLQVILELSQEEASAVIRNAERFAEESLGDEEEGLESSLPAKPTKTPPEMVGKRPKERKEAGE